MIEIRIPKEIKNYREKLFFGLTLRQCICAGVALLICVPLYIFGNRFLPQEMISWLVVLIAAPLMLAGFFRYNDMTFEQFAVEFLEHHFHSQKRIYAYEPIFMELRREYLAQELQEEIAANTKKSGFFRKGGKNHAGQAETILQSEGRPPLAENTAERDICEAESDEAAVQTVPPQNRMRG